MSKKPLIVQEFVRVVEKFPFEDVDKLPFQDRILISSTFLRLVELSQSLPYEQAEDCFLLLTTCRNRWYTVNAMYAEAQKWCLETRNHKGFANALDALRGAVSKSVALDKAAQSAASILKTTADYLQEFFKKYDLYFNHFHEVHDLIGTFVESISDTTSKLLAKEIFFKIGQGPFIDDYLIPPERSAQDIFLDRLLVWYSLSRPLTSLARTYISEVLEIGEKHHKKINDYLDEISKSEPGFKSFGFHFPEVPSEETFSWRRLTKPLGNYDLSLKHVQTFVTFCDAMYETAKTFLKQMIPSKESASASERFLLLRPEDKLNIAIAGRQYQRSNMFVLITDMRNSTGARYESEVIKTLIDDIICDLRSTMDVRSQTVLDDCRVIACESFEKIKLSVARLWNALEARKSPDGFAGLRIGLSFGEMLFDYSGPWQDIKKAIPLDSSVNTIARAARLMNLDKIIWDEKKGEEIRKSLGALTTEESLLFIDSSVYEKISDEDRAKCHQIGIQKFGGVGSAQCWAIPISKFV